MDTPATPGPPAQDPSPAPVRPYGNDSARLMEDYPEYGIMSFLPLGNYAARARAESGEFTGDLISADSLDELAGKLDRIRRRLAGM